MGGGKPLITSNDVIRNFRKNGLFMGQKPTWNGGLEAGAWVGFCLDDLNQTLKDF